jgi:hypothetical protein
MCHLVTDFRTFIIFYLVGVCVVYARMYMCVCVCDIGGGGGVVRAYGHHETSEPLKELIYMTN